MSPRRPASLAETLPFDRESTATGALTATIGEPFGPYMVYEKLGEGGMARVHRAELVGEGGLRKPVALKRLHTQTAEDPDFVEAFVHEAQLAAKLQHPNIAQAYDLGKIDDTYYIAMELISGPTLAQVMTVSARGGAGAVPLSISLEILIQLCDALDHAHDMRDDAGNPLDLVHRDVSPMNVIISKTGCVKLIDFGIAKIRSARRVTEAGVIKGKHAYVAPEYTYGQLDRRADIFGLGVVAHELLTGRRLFLADTDLDTIRNVREMPIPPPSRYASNVPPELDAIVLAALERDPDKRWPNAGAMRAALQEEVRRLGVRVSGREIRDWAEWAFQQSPRSDSSVDRMLDGMDASKSMSISIEDECPPVSRMSASQVAAIVQAPTVRLPTVERPKRAATVRAATGTGGSTGSIVARAPTELAPASTTDTAVPREVSPRKETSVPTIDMSARDPMFGWRAETTGPTLDMSAGRPETELPTIDMPALELSTLRAASSAPRAASPTLRAASSTPRAVSAGLVAEPMLVPAPPILGIGKPSRARAPRWRPPTRWGHPAPKRSAAPFVMLLALVGIAAALASAGYIDVDRWRDILATCFA